jgi:hypothetical protein
MTTITFWGSTYHGAAEGDHGVFTHSNGTVYAGSIAYGSACVGVATLTNGTTHFVECDADGKEHGRELACGANGHTRYSLCEHGNDKERAVLRADGACYYNGEACRADFTPFVALQARVLLIKARPPLVAQQPPPFPHFYAPHRPPVGPIGHVLALAGTGNNSRRQGARPPPPPSGRVGLVAQQLPSKCPARPTWTTHRREGALRMRHNRLRSAPFHRLSMRSEPPCASALPITCRTPSGSVAACGGLHVSLLHPTRRAHANARRRRVSHRAPALRPHLAHQIAMRIRCAIISIGVFFSTFSDP